MNLNVDRLPLAKGMFVGRCLRAMVLEWALSDSEGGMRAEARTAPAVARRFPGLASPLSAALDRSVRDPRFDRPIFIVSPPRSGSTLLFETLMTAPGLVTVGGESHLVMESIRDLTPQAHGWDSNRLTAVDARPWVRAVLRERFRAALRDRHGVPPGAGRVRMLEKTPKNALRIPFLASVFPEARFIYLYRDPRPTLASMMEGWSSGRYRTYPRLPGWTGPEWSFLLIPGWRGLIGAPLANIVATQWAAATGILLDDLATLPADRWRTVRYESFIAAPGEEVARLCKALDLDWDRRLGSTLPLSGSTLSKPHADKWRAREGEIDSVVPIYAKQDVRALKMVALSTPK